MVAGDLREGLARGWLFFVVLAFGLPLFAGLGNTDLANDEAIYSYAVESILDTGDWLSPRSSPNDDIVFLEKPPLKFWVVAAPIRAGLLPRSEFGLRFWDAAFGTLAFVYVFLIGRRLAGPVCGLVAVLVLFTHAPLVFEHGLRSNNMDAALVLSYCGGLYHVLRWTASGTRRAAAAHVAAVAAFFFAGFMVKFVAALFLPLVAGLWILLVPAHRMTWRRDRSLWLLAAAAVAVLVAPWFVYQHLKNGEMLWRVMFGEHVVTRFTAYTDPEHLQPWHFYVTAVSRELWASGSAPWVALGLIVVARSAIRTRGTEALLVLLWAFVPLAIISTGTSKLYHYVYPFLPPLAIAAGGGAAWIWGGVSRLTERLPAGRWNAPPPVWLRMVAGLMLAFGVTVAIATVVEGPLRISLGGTVFRNSHIVRPVLVALAGLTLLAGVRAGAAMAIVALLAVAVPTPLAAYPEHFERARLERRPLGRLSACFREIDALRVARGDAPGAPYAPVPSDAFLHPFFYYFRGTGWHSAVDDDAMRASLFSPETLRPVLVDASGYRAFLERHPDARPVPPSKPFANVLVLAPGPYGLCLSQ